MKKFIIPLTITLALTGCFEERKNPILSINAGELRVWLDANAGSEPDWEVSHSFPIIPKGKEDIWEKNLDSLYNCASVWANSQEDSSCNKEKLRMTYLFNISGLTTQEVLPEDIDEIKPVWMSFIARQTKRKEAIEEINSAPKKSLEERKKEMLKKYPSLRNF